MAIENSRLVETEVVNRRLQEIVTEHWIGPPDKAKCPCAGCHRQLTIPEVANLVTNEDELPTLFFCSSCTADPAIVERTVAQWDF